jgi:hypothetical protein
LSAARAASVASFAAPAGAASIAGHPREAGASTRRARGRRPAPLPAPTRPLRPTVPTDRAASAERRRDLVQAFEHQVLVVGELDGQSRA